MYNKPTTTLEFVKHFSVRVVRPSDDDNSYSVATKRGNYLHFLLVPLVWSIPSMWSK